MSQNDANDEWENIIMNNSQRSCDNDESMCRSNQPNEKRKASVNMHVVNG